MYEPIQDGIEKKTLSVSYKEREPPGIFSGLVHNFWELKTDEKLTDDFYLHAIPDACVNILFNQKDTRIAGITALHTTYEVLNLGTEFHYVGIQFFPGVWKGDLNETAKQFVGTPYLGNLPLIENNNKMAELEFTAKQHIMTDLVSELITCKLVAINTVTAKIVSDIDSIKTVADMAALTQVSPRQLQRILKSSTGFSPHDFLKVLRLQRSFKQNYLDSYADQSHFIHSFRKITGYTPVEYFRKFDV